MTSGLRGTLIPTTGRERNRPRVTEDVYEPFSIRERKRTRSGLPSTYVYHPISATVRAQIVHAVNAAIGPYHSYRNEKGSIYPYRYYKKAVANWSSPIWDLIIKTIMEEHGLPSMYDVRLTYQEKFEKYLLTVQQSAEWVDALEIALRCCLAADRESPPYGSKAVPLAAALEQVHVINRRLSNADLGYEFQTFPPPGFIVKKDSEFLHREVVEPAIQTLYSAGFHGPLDEFMRAHSALRRGDNKSAVNEALKSFESTMKAICSSRGWKIDPNASASRLIDTIFANGIIPLSLQSQFTAIRSLLESGVPTIRNKHAGHGQGVAVIEMPDYLATYAIHISAANIVLLMSALDE